MSLNRKRPLIPSVEEFTALPRLAGMAFATRCVRRVVPIYRFAWPMAPMHHLTAVENAVRVVEENRSDLERSEAAFAAAAAADAAARVSSGPAYDTARAAARLAGSDSVSAAVFAIRGACDALVRVATVTTPLTRQLRLVRRDFDRLVQLAKVNGWTDETLVSVEAFGKMWPGGGPEWWSSKPDLKS